MTTLNKILALGLILQSLFMVACAKDSSSSPAAVVTYSLGTNGLCYQTGTTTQVASNLCSTTTGTYQMIGNVCYLNQNGVATQQVASTYCYNNTGTIGGVSCVGVYIWNQQYRRCSGADCANYTLINAQTGQSQVCI